LGDATLLEQLRVRLVNDANGNGQADAGEEVLATRAMTETVQLDGRASRDADGDPIGYRWALIVVPEGSTATLSNTSVAQPTFVAGQATRLEPFRLTPPPVGPVYSYL
jgi:hypothetical protein